jgi:UDP-N-acetyl-D-mannosaminuronate dehydrogenase
MNLINFRYVLKIQNVLNSTVTSYSNGYDKRMLICVLGLGQIGLPVAEYIKEKGLSVIGYDIRQEAVNRAEQKGIPAFLEWDEAHEAEVYIVCVSTWNDDGKPNLTVC